MHIDVCPALSRLFWPLFSYHLSIGVATFLPTTSPHFVRLAGTQNGLLDSNTFSAPFGRFLNPFQTWMTWMSGWPHSQDDTTDPRINLTFRRICGDLRRGELPEKEQKQQRAKRRSADGMDGNQLESVIF